MRAPYVHMGLMLWLADRRPARPLTATAVYDPADPYAVVLAVVDGETVTHWTFARDLLVDGLHAPAGVGDVHVEPADSDGWLLLTLWRGPQVPALVAYTARREVEALLDRSFALVPMSREADHLDVDAALAALIGGAS
jgi:hypothetical protein